MSPTNTTNANKDPFSLDVEEMSGCLTRAVAAELNRISSLCWQLLCSTAPVVCHGGHLLSLSLFQKEGEIISWPSMKVGGMKINEINNESFS